MCDKVILIRVAVLVCTSNWISPVTLISTTASAQRTLFCVYEIKKERGGPHCGGDATMLLQTVSGDEVQIVYMCW